MPRIGIHASHEQIVPSRLLAAVRLERVLAAFREGGGVLVSADLEQHAAWVRELAALGFDAIYLHHVGQELEPFVDDFGERVLPALG